MNEETEALAYSQLLLLHADTITDSGVKEMVVNSAAELTILHLRVEALRLENERLREALTYDWDQLEACRESLREHMVEIKRLRSLLTEAKDLAWAFGADSLRDRISDALNQDSQRVE